MAHAIPSSRRIRAAIVAAVAFAWAGAAAATVLGDIEVRSAPGEPLEARIAFSPGPGEPLEESCFRVARGPRAAGKFVTRARITLEEGAGARFLRVRTPAPISDLDVILRVVVACPGPDVLAWRDYRRLFAARTGTPTAGAAPGAAPASVGVAPGATTRSTEPPRATGPGLVALEGDSLESLARAIFPRHRKARGVYLAALREENPALASLGDGDPIAPGTSVILPDLRTFARGRDVREDSAPAKAPALSLPTRTAPTPETPKAKPAAAKAAPSMRDSPVAATRPPAAPPEAARPPAAQRRAATARDAGGGFVLRLSAPEVDLSRSRGVDDRLRAQLRERLLVLDADDQVAALLSLRNSLKQLEGRVADLQLKLAGMPATLPAAAPPREDAARTKPATDPGPAATTAPATPKPESRPPAPPPPTIESRPAGPEKAPTMASAPADPAAASPRTGLEKKGQAESAREITAPSPPPSAPNPSARPVPEPNRPAFAGELPAWLWAVVALLAAGAAWIAWRLWRGRAPGAGDAGHAEPESAFLPAGEPAPGVEEELEIAAELSEPHASPPPAPAGRRVMASDADLATSVTTGDPGELRKRYLEQRFPEIANRTIALDDPDSVVKGARLLYEDGALPRAVELLQFAIEEKPAEVKPWLALFEIFRLEGLAGEFAELAGRFREHHGRGDYWHKVQYFGREIDPANPLYREPAFAHLETIGLPAPASLPAAPAFDPLAENWLNAPMDFTDEVLANELRRAVMAQAGLSERDLVPNPMPALRNVEMFTVA